LSARYQVEQHIRVVRALARAQSVTSKRGPDSTRTHLANGINQQPFCFLVLSESQVAHRQTVEERNAGAELVNQLLERIPRLNVLFAALVSRSNKLYNCTLQGTKSHPGGRTEAAFTHAFANWVSVDSSSAVCMRFTCFCAKSRREIRTKICTVNAILQTGSATPNNSSGNQVGIDNKIKWWPRYCCKSVVERTAFRASEKFSS
jgi:hypothetical protein